LGVKKIIGFPTEMMKLTLIYAGIFVFLAVVVYFYDKIKKRKLELAVKKSEEEAVAEEKKRVKKLGKKK
jgi:preprotein translocase subunit SecG